MNVAESIPKYLKAIYQTADFSNLSGLIEFPSTLWLFNRVRHHTMIDIPRLKSLYFLTREADSLKLQGDIVECGVFHGGSAAVMAYASRKSVFRRDIWLFDSFEGMPRPTEKDDPEAFKQFHGVWNKGDVSKVKQIFEELKIPQKRVHIVKGWFQDTFPSVEIPRITILHIDANWYESVKLSLSKFYDNVVPRGYIVIDDYGCWEGCKLATDEFINSRKLSVKLLRIDPAAYYFQKEA